MWDMELRGPSLEAGRPRRKSLSHYRKLETKGEATRVMETYSEDATRRIW